MSKCARQERPSIIKRKEEEEETGVAHDCSSGLYLLFSVH